MSVLPRYNEVGFRIADTTSLVYILGPLVNEPAISERSGVRMSPTTSYSFPQTVDLDSSPVDAANEAVNRVFGNGYRFHPATDVSGNGFR